MSERATKPTAIPFVAADDRAKQVVLDELRVVMEHVQRHGAVAVVVGIVEPDRSTTTFRKGTAMDRFIAAAAAHANVQFDFVQAGVPVDVTETP